MSYKLLSTQLCTYLVNFLIKNYSSKSENKHKISACQMCRATALSSRSHMYTFKSIHLPVKNNKIKS